MLSTFTSALTSQKPLFSLGSITQVFENLHAEKTALESESSQIVVQRKQFHNELQDIDRTLRELYERKSVIETNLERLASQEVQIKEKKELLEKKIQTIGEESLRFEANIRNISTCQAKEDFTPPVQTHSSVLQGHQGPVQCVRVDGLHNRLVSGSLDMTVKLWNLHSETCVGTLVGHSGGVRSVAFSDAHVVSGSSDSTLRIWDATNGDCLHVLSSHTGPVNSVQFDRQKLVSGSDDTFIKIWDMERGQCINTFTKNVPIKCIQFFEHALTTAGDNIIRMWDTRSGSCCRQLTGHSAAITCLQFDEFNLISGSEDETVRVWDLRTGTCQKTLMMRSPVNTLNFNSTHLLVGLKESEVRVYSPVTFHHKRSLQGSTQEILSVKFSNNSVIGGSVDNTIQIWKDVAP